MRISNETLVKKIDKCGFCNRRLSQINEYLKLTGKDYKYDYEKFFEFLRVHRITFKVLSDTLKISTGELQYWRNGNIGFETWQELISIINHDFKNTDSGVVRFENDIKKEDFITKL